MRHYLLLGDERQVLGVWEAPDDVAAARFVLKLSLAYPECTTVVDRASDFESFKAGHGDFDFDGIEPEPVSM
ncbi:MAG: hypothetical protein IPG45_15075 [Deltaproteobacteria bacterium]|jgi:hypothetical protein|nr:hypothetical protein [Deltaproteobacteria bacterium]